MEGFTQRQTIELTQSNPVLVRDQPLVKGDAQALVWIVTVKENGVPVDLTGATASLYCARALSEDGSGGTTFSAATIESGGEVRAVLPTDAANIPGPVGCMIRVSRDGVSVAVARMAVMAVDQTGDDILDEGKRIPSLDEIIASIDRCDAAAEKAEGAAASVGDALKQVASAIEAANGATSDARNAAGQATDGASAAKAAATTATAAATKIDGMTITATGLAAGAAPTAKLTEVDGHYNIVLGLPKGDKGDPGATPQITVQVKTGEPGTAASVAQSGTAENPVITLTIPRGDTGSVGTLTINGKAPDAAGKVELAAADVSALGEDAQAKDSAKLAGKAPEYYIQPRNLLDNSDFTNPVAQAGYNGIHGATKYICDRWISWDADATFNGKNVTLQTFADQHINPEVIDETKQYTIAIGLADGRKLVDHGDLSTGFGMWATCWAGKGSDGVLYARLGGGQSIVWAALYEGVYTAETVPPYTPKGYAAELAECQRYFYRHDGVVYLTTRGDSYQTCHVYFPTSMRATPTISNINKTASVSFEFSKPNFASFGADGGALVSVNAFDASADL